MNALATKDVLSALSVLPEDMWDVQDDKCDCVYQRIGFWTNPYLSETLEVRMCCIWAELYKFFPQFVRVTPAFYDYNRDEWESEPREWTADFDMPPAIWHRQLARAERITVAEAREKYADKDYLRPKGVKRPEPEPVETVDPIGILFEMVTGLAEIVSGIANRLDAAGLASVLTGEDSNSGAAESDDHGANQISDGEVAP